MTTLRAFTCDDLFRCKNTNLDPLTETYGIPFYLHYLADWPEYFMVAEAPGGELMGYITGKAEGSVAREEWRGHVTALSVAPGFRRLGLAAKLVELLEEISEKKGGFFVDFFVRVSNQVAAYDAWQKKAQEMKECASIADVDEQLALHKKEEVENKFKKLKAQLAA